MPAPRIVAEIFFGGTTKKLERKPGDARYEAAGTPKLRLLKSGVVYEGSVGKGAQKRQ